MAVDKLVDSTQLDADLTSVANAIRTKGGTSADLAFPAGFVSAVHAIPSGGGGGDFEIEDGTVVLSSESKTVTVSCSFQPESAMIAAKNDSSWPTDNKWRTLVGSIPFWGLQSYATQRYGTSNIAGAGRGANEHSYSSGSLTFSWNYAMASGVTYYWYAWRAKS